MTASTTTTPAVTAVSSVSSITECCIHDAKQISHCRHCFFDFPRQWCRCNTNHRHSFTLSSRSQLDYWLHWTLKGEALRFVTETVSQKSRAEETRQGNTVEFKGWLQRKSWKYYINVNILDAATAKYHSSFRWLTSSQRPSWVSTGITKRQPKGSTSNDAISASQASLFSVVNIQFTFSVVSRFTRKSIGREARISSTCRCSCCSLVTDVTSVTLFYLLRPRLMTSCASSSLSETPNQSKGSLFEEEEAEILFSLSLLDLICSLSSVLFLVNLIIIPSFHSLASSLSSWHEVHLKTFLRLISCLITLPLE